MEVKLKKELKLIFDIINNSQKTIGKVFFTIYLCVNYSAW